MRMFLGKVLAYVVGVLAVIMGCIILMICMPIAVVACLMMGCGLDEMFDEDIKETFKLIDEAVKEMFKSINKEL